MSKVFETLTAIDVAPYTKKKDIGGGKSLSYLSWAIAWDLVKKAFPAAQYEVVTWNGIPYLYDPVLGYMVGTIVTIEGERHTQLLPVFDGANKAMRDVEYQYQTRAGSKKCEAATMMDINKAILRCLVKTLALFGLGIDLYIGEDLDSTDEVNSAYLVPKIWKGEEWLTDKEYNELLQIRSIAVLYAKILEYAKTKKARGLYKEALQERLDQLAAEKEKSTETPHLSKVMFADDYQINSILSANEAFQAFQKVVFTDENERKLQGNYLLQKARNAGFEFDPEQQIFIKKMT